MKDFLKSKFHKDLREVDLSVKGWNWGEARFRGSLFGFYVDNKPAFEIPLKEVSQVYVLYTSIVYMCWSIKQK